MSDETTAPHPLIQYRGYHAGPKDTGGMTSLYPTKEQALRVAKACSYRDETTWANPVYLGPLDAILVAVEPVEYTDWRGGPQRKVIRAGEEFRPGDVMAADRQVDEVNIGLWLVKGKVKSLPVAPLQ
jgi:hypothetical protein